MGQDLSCSAVAAILGSHYAQPGARLARVRGGHSTQNYRAVTRSGPDLFVKVYPEGSDDEAERRAIALAQWAGEHGVPTARLRESVNAEALTRVGPTALAVWEWVPGQTESTGFSPSQQTAVGRALGRIHSAFVHHRLSRTASPWTEEWFSPGLAAVYRRIDSLLRTVDARESPDAFDVLARRTLTTRRSMLAEVPDLLTGLPRDLTTQVLHGDFTAPNLLFDDKGLAAVIDFRPPVPYMVSFELGRIAFDPRTVALDERWIDSAARLVNAYLEENPGVSSRDVLSCGRVILIQMLRSLYGIEQHYLAPDPDQEGLDRYWALRHHATVRIWENLEKVESMLADVSVRR
ncbi:aminoglycoside phosphotransferase family protein [Nocardiopsis tropica]|uniref:Aminoglycoside phosphotransferase family protein n=1 Tax=Nocardiopsis tropica TaxID=109330 RepID=A0ABU7KP78_9ACTN|nr:aminoglycoside phosphotransferase family protein [Nocardiopsis umidischolae]MEE2051100.1 aminoglycoside phosphotransferase family protein [Nocardiopsis umidischolae]